MNVKITVQEKITYINEIIVQQPHYMSDEQLAALIGKVEMECRNDSTNNIATILQERYGIEIIEQSITFPENPNYSMVEIIDIENL